MDGSPCGLLLGLLGDQSPRLSLSSVIIRFSIYISIHFREKLASNEYGWRLRGDSLLIRIRAKELSEDPLTADTELTRVFAKQKTDEQTVMQWGKNSVWKPVVVKQAGIGSLAEDDALNILSPVSSKSVCLKQGVPISKQRTNDSISTVFYNKERAGTELVDTVESVVDSEAVEIVVADLPYLK
ncbi:hypothetical protein M9H77_06472 [Catharanthus roseus]|uniref:Uncharacterized protein n=1 Tax=Catharanthus roseus TaxID=4058 RepID=A0ACC0BSF6_CATRO|nr:hypothetical protein M9H77_06472 [Catharanthus roseus]